MGDVVFHPEEEEERHREQYQGVEHQQRVEPSNGALEAGEESRGGVDPAEFHVGLLGQLSRRPSLSGGLAAPTLR